MWIQLTGARKSENTEAITVFLSFPWRWTVASAVQSNFPPSERLFVPPLWQTAGLWPPTATRGTILDLLDVWCGFATSLKCIVAPQGLAAFIVMSFMSFYWLSSSQRYDMWGKETVSRVWTRRNRAWNRGERTSSDPWEPYQDKVTWRLLYVILIPEYLINEPNTCAVSTAGRVLVWKVTAV